MQVKTKKKLSHSAVATVLVTSSIATGLPVTTSAATQFPDVKPSAFYYNAVNNLVSKGIIKGYPDGRFLPDESVTRAEAAKMLADAAGIDVTYSETNKYSDIKNTDWYYPYVAALSNLGIIDGFPDGTFRPNEPVERGQMAKMLVSSFSFMPSENKQSIFNDVKSNVYFAPFVQTLVELKITEGTSGVTFSPYDVVKRGQMAAFIDRAFNAKAKAPTYIINDVQGNIVYINSVPYTIGPGIAPYIKQANREVLKGAKIEGIFDGRTLKSISTLTLYAKGTDKSIVTLDGGSANFYGKLVIKGSYLKFKNWNLYGETIVDENASEVLSPYNLINMLSIPSLSSSDYIDFGKPTDPGDSHLNDGDDRIEYPDEPYFAKLSTVKKYVDFSNTYLHNLNVVQNFSYVRGDREVNAVTVRHDAEYVELDFPSIRDLYLEGDKHLTLYGTHDIGTVYKNSKYDVFFNTNSYIETLIVTEKQGWIDLGAHVTIDTVILPKDTKVNEVFDDFVHDNDKIGTIEDTDGEEVDREPDEVVIPDIEAPIVKSLSVIPDSNMATVSLTVNETGKYYYVVMAAGDRAPTVREIINGEKGVITGNGVITDNHKIADEEYIDSFVIRGLDSVTKYTLYLVHVDDARNYSAKQERSFETKDGTPPTFLTKSVKPLPGGKRVQFDFKPSETGKYYYFLREAQNIDSSITVDDVIDGAQDSGTVTNAMVQNGHSIIIRKDENGNPLKAESNYVIYSVLVDDSGNKIMQADMFAARVKTDKLDEIPPYVTGPSANQQQMLEPVQSGDAINEFYLYFSEKVVKETAEDVNNYQLSGTGIVNVPGQKEITPSKVVYEESRNRVKITIPSLTGFVNGDTLRVTVLPGVMDLAENPFENKDNAPNNQEPRNYAEYKHNDTLLPYIRNFSIVKNTENTVAKVNFEATKAGTVYYMILPKGTDLAALGIDARDFVDEFNPNTATGKFNVPGTSEKIYLEGAGNLKPGLTAELGAQSFDYDLTNLTPNPFIAYDLYMVLKDRSGNLSSIVNKTIIEDKKAPEISAFNVEAKKLNANSRDNTEAEIQIQSDEGGTVLYRLVKKYVVDAPATADTPATYKLNPLVYNADGTLKTTIPGTEDYAGNTNAKKEQAFRDYFTETVKSGEVPMNAGLTSVPISGLTALEEYVAVVAVKDTYGNFTVYSKDGKLLVEDFYEDHTVPTIIDKLVYRNVDDTYTITFSEAIMREYESNNSIKQVSNIANMDLSDILTITGTSTTGEAIDLTNNFTIVSYEYDERSLQDPSRLTIKPVGPNLHQTIDIQMKDTTVDQIINDNKPNAFNLEDFGRYVHRNIQGDFLQILFVPNTDDRRVEAIFDLLSTDIQFDADERIKYYYTVKTALTPVEQLESYTIDQIIKDANAAYSGGTNSATLVGGLGTVAVLDSRAQIIMEHQVKFVANDYVVLVLEDRFGNRIKRYNRIGYRYEPETTNP